MRDNEQLKILQKGVNAWNRWRHDNPKQKVNLDFADLDGMNLASVDLSDASLIAATLRRTKLTLANLSHVDLTSADLSDAILCQSHLEWAHLAYANLARANLTEADLLATEFVGTSLSEATFNHATIGGTKFQDIDLSVICGLDTVIHIRPSHIGIDSVYRSNGNIPERFLRGAGVPDDFIIQIPSLVLALQPIQFYSCFISYSSDDEQFAKRLYSRMREERLRVWFAPEDARGGQKLHEQIESAIQFYDRLLIVLSPSSMRSNWVITELRDARQAEIKNGRRKLFPIRLVDFKTIKAWKCFDSETGTDLAVELREYFVPDFTQWKDHDAFEQAFKRLLRDLTAGQL